jgi:cytochrome c peroxidase
MRRGLLFAAWAISTLSPISCLATDDALLHKVTRAFDLKAHVPAARPFGAKERLGQALFFDPIVSGPRSIACATCHVRSLGAGDGLPLAVGVGGTGISEERVRSSSGFVVPRNAMPLFNRGSKDFVAFFWDGRVQHGKDGRFESPLGNRLPSGFENLLAVAAVFPMAEPDEMLGRRASKTGSRGYHGELVGGDVDSDNYQARTGSVFANLITRLLAPGVANPDPVVRRYRGLFHAAYPDVAMGQFNIAELGNVLAAYIAAAFELRPAPWDRYVAGDAQALTEQQKQGALLFYGKGRCAVCHAGVQFSDFRFHALAVPQQRIGKHGPFLDYGRAGATSRGTDRFAFRTPPLRNVVHTGPWGHNGYFSSLEAVIAHHANPIPGLYATQQQSPLAAEQTGRLVGFRSPILAEMPPLSPDEIRQLVKFLGAISSSTVMSDEIAVPADVPSGNRQFIRR